MRGGNEEAAVFGDAVAAVLYTPGIMQAKRETKENAILDGNVPPSPENRATSLICGGRQRGLHFRLSHTGSLCMATDRKTTPIVRRAPRNHQNVEAPTFSIARPHSLCNRRHRIILAAIRMSCVFFFLKIGCIDLRPSFKWFIPLEPRNNNGKCNVHGGEAKRGAAPLQIREIRTCIGSK